MLQVALNHHYEITYNSNKRRFYLKICGLWSHADQISGYVSHWEEALSLTNGERFNILSDLSDMEKHPEDVLEIHKIVETLWDREGLLNKTAIVTAANPKLKKIAPFSYSKRFDTLQEADHWLEVNLM
ncbi:MAG: hypothetical protein MI784_08680 [Cytophagales bacterium]|nr:hypothetical protein [Cytophagales bacterium]